MCFAESVSCGQAAATLAALSVAEPASACRLLTQQLDGLDEACSKLASLVRHAESCHATSVALPPGSAFTQALRMHGVYLE